MNRDVEYLDTHQYRHQGKSRGDRGKSREPREKGEIDDGGRVAAEGGGRGVNDG